jgi:hypothetical protein
MTFDPDSFARAMHERLHGHQERRVCTADAPMPEADKDRYRWSHPDAEVGERVSIFANVVNLCKCPHCGLTFTSFPRPS